MKIDEPKTPFVTEDEFKKLCDEDSDYQKEFGEKLDVNSHDADDNSDRQMSDDLALAQKNMLYNMNINVEATSDQEMDNQSSDGNLLS